MNFLAVGRMDVLADLPMQVFYVTPHVDDEISHHYPEQRNRLSAALKDGSLQQTRLEGGELVIFTKLVGWNLGCGEAAAIAGAFCRGCAVGLDDRVAQRRARDLSPDLPIVTTKDLLLDAVACGTLTVTQADAIKGDLETLHRFRMPGFGSFGELLSNN
ncbi:MAG: hypothetical protein IT432_12075 [Phycisphaerales bacterium]|nr:hypothetical protein [Phycisphaerales bacterium]